METQNCLSRHYKFISEENITILSVSSDDYLHTSLWSHSSNCDVREACKKSSDETESIVIFSAEINLLWQLNRVWVSIKLYYIYIYIKPTESDQSDKVSTTGSSGKIIPFFIEFFSPGISLYDLYLQIVLSGAFYAVRVL